mgnify:CR=1 FL=1
MRILKAIGVLFIVILLGFVYGIFHNQISYSISSEVFTQLFFDQFGFVEYGTDTPRLTAGIIGVWSTLYLSLILGFLYFLLILIFNPNWKFIKKGIIIHLFSAFVISILGLIYGYFNVISLKFMKLDNFHQIKEPTEFSMAIWMHNFSYYGGIIGLILAFAYILKNRNN